MTSFLLLLLSLMAGCETKSEVIGCRDGWVEFTCKYPKQKGQYQSIAVGNPRNASIESTKKNKWENKGSVSLYHDPTNKELRVNIKRLEEEDFGRYQCKFSSRSKQPKELSLADEKDGCQRPFVQTAYGTAKTTITCDYPGNETIQSSVKFLCKDNSFTCENILSNKSSPNSNGTLTFTQSNSVFMSISNVSPRDAGVYWCGVEPNDGSYRAGLKKIQLEVKSIKTFTRSPTIGQNFTYWCEYPNGTPIKKFICKGEDPSICEPLASTQNNTNTRFSMKDDIVKRNITITVREITANDTGTYWCGAERNETTHSNPFFHRFLMTVASTPTSPVDGSQVIITVPFCVTVLLLLLFVLILILIYREFSHSNNTRNGAAPKDIREDYIYEEIPDRVRELDSGNGVTTIYATANLPTNPSASLHYCTINFEANSSDKADGEALVLKPRSACEYSSVTYSPSPAYNIINEACSSSQDALYSTVNKSQ